MKGQTLIETLIALAVAIMILSSVVVTVLVSLNNAQFSKNQNLATQYAQEGMEVVRGIRNGSWTDFSSKSGDFCLLKSEVTISPRPIGGSCSTIDNVFTREVNIVWSVERTTSTVTVKVSWTDSKGRHESKLISYFTREGAQ